MISPTGRQASAATSSFGCSKASSEKAASMSRTAAALWHQRVTARLGDQDGRAGGVFLDLLPQPVDVRLERVSGEPGIVAPDFLQQCLSRYQDVGQHHKDIAGRRSP